ncbi:MAG: class I SAM-dependent methyltransferase [Phycisphaeraceae bacterium]|nr:class I SAM-dependent methyltransferase [Phycisphaeraceae bacterium]
MSQPAQSPEPYTGTPADLRRILADAGYMTEAVPKLARLAPMGSNVDPEAIRAALAEPTPPNLLARLFYAAQPLPRAQAESLLAPLSCEPLINAGLLRAEGDSVRSVGAVVPIANRLCLRDFESWATGMPMQEDYVLGVGLATTMLAGFTVRRAGERVLDIGTGQGFQAMCAAEHAAEVIGTDINRHALDFAAVSLRLNAIDNVRLRHGSFFEPVADERGTFDLLVSNPPFVIAPPHDLAAIGGRWEGDRFVQDLISTAPEFLRDGGYATILCNWHHPSPDEPFARPLSWLSGRGVDAWIVRLKTDSPETYARQWLRETAAGNGQAAMTAAGNSLEHWLDYYRRLNIGAISLGVVYLRRRAAGGPNWSRTDSLSMDNYTGHASAQVQRLFDAETTLRSLPTEESVLDLRLELSPAAELAQRLALDQGAWKPRQSLLRETAGFEFAVGLDGLTTQILAALRPDAPAREHILALAKSMRADPQTAIRQTAPFLARMLKLSHVRVAGR